MCSYYRPSNNSLGLGDQPSTAVQENTGDRVAFYFCPRSRGQQDGQISAISVCFSCKMGVLPTEGLAGKFREPLGCGGLPGARLPVTTTPVCGEGLLVAVTPSPAGERGLLRLRHYCDGDDQFSDVDVL